MSRLFRKTTMRRAIVEAVGIFVAWQLLSLVSLDVWPGWAVPLVFLLRLALMICPPVWAAMRVVSTRREKMSRRFWRLGPQLALACWAVGVVIALVLGEASAFGGRVGEASDLARFSMRGRYALTPGDFVRGQLVTLVALAIYYTIAVVCTRLANGGFLRFTMPAGNGRVTL